MIRSIRSFELHTQTTHLPHVPARVTARTPMPLMVAAERRRLGAAPRLRVAERHGHAPRLRDDGRVHGAVDPAHEAPAEDRAATEPRLQRADRLRERRGHALGPRGVPDRGEELGAGRGRVARRQHHRHREREEHLHQGPTPRSG